MKKKSNVILGRSFILQDLCNFARSGNYTMGTVVGGEMNSNLLYFCISKEDCSKAYL